MYSTARLESGKNIEIAIDNPGLRLNTLFSQCLFCRLPLFDLSPLILPCFRRRCGPVEPCLIWQRYHRWWWHYTRRAAARTIDRGHRERQLLQGAKVLRLLLNGQPQLLELDFLLAEVWSVAAENALPGLRFDALLIDNNQSETRGLHPGTTIVLYGLEMLFVKVVRLVYSAAKERRGPRSAHVGLDIRKHVCSDRWKKFQVTVNVDRCISQVRRKLTINTQFVVVRAWYV